MADKDSTPGVEDVSHPRVDGAEEEGAEEMEVEETADVSHRDPLPEVPSAGQEIEREDGEITDSPVEPNPKPINMAMLQSALVEVGMGMVDDRPCRLWEQHRSAHLPFLLLLRPLLRRQVLDHLCLRTTSM